MSNIKYIIGADEVGTGAYAGPGVFCGVRAPIDWFIPGLNDSKKLNSARREELSAALLGLNNITYVLVCKSNVEIDTHGLGACIKQAYQEIADRLLPPKNDLTNDTTMVIDGTVRLPKADSRVTCLVKADQKLPSVMAASILAKVYRDNLMHKLSEQYPVYDWTNNVGYGVTKHKEAIKKFGLCDLHRKSYKIKL
jgi:ribonuclease HII